MLDSKKIRYIAESYSAQELFAALVWQGQFIDLGKKWRADSVEVTDGNNPDLGWKLRRRLRARLDKALSREHNEQICDAVIIAYCWD